MSYAILICDDEAQLAEEVAQYFELNGWSVCVALSFREASERFMSERQFDCLLTDWLLPETPGDALVAFAIALPAGKAPKVIAIMSGVSVSLASEFGDLVNFLVRKPFDPKLVEALFLSELEGLKVRGLRQ